MDFPEYRRLNEQFEVAILINGLSPDKLASALTAFMNDDKMWEKLHRNCLEARKCFNWQTEEQILIDFYKKLLPVE